MTDPQTIITALIAAQAEQAAEARATITTLETERDIADGILRTLLNEGALDDGLLWIIGAVLLTTAQYAHLTIIEDAAKDTAHES